MNVKYYLDRAARPHGDYVELTTPEAKGRPLYATHERPRLTPEQIERRVCDVLSGRRAFTDGIKLAKEIGADVVELSPVLSALEECGALQSSARGYRMAPVPSTDRVKKLREGNRLSERFRKDYYVTDEEHEILKNHLKALRGEYVE